MRVTPADLLDVAKEVELAATEAAIARVLAEAKESVLRLKGRCYNCDERVENTLLFCDEDCRDDYERRETRKGRR